MKYFLSKLISKQKGETFVLDSDIPLLYILKLLINKSISLFYGLIMLKKIKFILILQV